MEFTSYFPIKKKNRPQNQKMFLLLLHWDLVQIGEKIISIRER